MANSGQMTTDNQYIVYRIECTQNSQNISNNSSNVTVKVWFWRTNTGYETYGTGTCYCKINGTTYSDAITSSQKITNSGIYLFQRTVDIGHNSDGTKSLGMSAWITHSRVSSSEQSYTQQLSTIPRTSSASLSTTSPSFGNNIKISISRASSSFTHTIQQDFYAGSWSNIATGVATEHTWTLPWDYMNRIPNSTSGGGRIRVITYSGSTYIGEVVLSFTAYVPGSVVPVVTKLDTWPVGVDVGGYVAGKHSVGVSMAGTWNGGANYSTVKIVVDGQTYWGTSATSGTIWTDGSKSVSTVMTDSRGRTGSSSKNINFWGYWNPTCSISVYRCDASGNRDDTNGTHVRITVYGNACNVGEVNRNSPVCKIQWKNSTDSSWTDYYTLGNSISGANYNISDNRVTSGWSIDKPYDIRVVISDKWVTSMASSNVNTGFTTMDFLSGGKGMAIGKIAQSEGLEIGMTTKMYNSICFMQSQHAIAWQYNTDEALIGFKNDGNDDTDSYMYFQTGDDDNEYFLWRHRRSATGGFQNYMYLKSDGNRINGNSWAWTHVNTSDINYKENVVYIKSSDSPKTLEIADKVDTNITTYDMYDFIKDDYKMTMFNYIGMPNTELGFIAQDVEDTVIGKYLLSEDEGHFVYSTGTYFGIIVGALQEEIRIRDMQNESSIIENEALKEEISKLKVDIQDLKEQVFNLNELVSGIINTADK